MISTKKNLQCNLVISNPQKLFHVLKKKELLYELSENTDKENKEAWHNYISGFVDGEGCFSISFRLLSKHLTGVEVRPSFSLAQKKSPENYRLLENIRNTFGVGGIRDDGRGCYKYESRSLKDLTEKIIPFFKIYKLYSDKYNNFSIFQDICSRMEKREHLTIKGLQEILTLSLKLNPSGTKRISRTFLKSKIKG